MGEAGATDDRAGQAETLCRRYLAALESGDLDAILACFAPDAIANSPVFVSTSGPPRAAVHVAYTRAIAGHPPATIDVVDVFDLTPDGDRIAAVTIVYDTAPVRKDFEPVGGGAA